MSNSRNLIAVVGAGRVGIAVATLVSQNTPHKVLIIDADPGALNVARATGAAFESRLCETPPELDAELRASRPFAVVCCTPFHINIQIAKICAEIKAHYIDFTEDVGVTKAVAELNPIGTTFVLQTGLAPGLITSVGMSLLKKLCMQNLTPTALHMRVGALPEVALFPAAYALTWSSSGLVNEYFQPVERIVNGAVVIAEPLHDHEDIMVDGIHMEAFNTSGGMGVPSMYTGLETVDYKTMRYPGHLAFLQKHLIEPSRKVSISNRLAKGIELAEALFPRTRDDVVYMVVRAQGRSQAGVLHETVLQHRFYGAGGLTALELTTAGTGAAVVELLGSLPTGIMFGGQISLDALLNTVTGRQFLVQVTAKSK